MAEWWPRGSGRWSMALRVGAEGRRPVQGATRRGRAAGSGCHGEGWRSDGQWRVPVEGRATAVGDRGEGRSGRWMAPRGGPGRRRLEKGATGRGGALSGGTAGRGRG